MNPWRWLCYWLAKHNRVILKAFAFPLQSTLDTTDKTIFLELEIYFITPCGSPFTPAQDKAVRDWPDLPPQPRACLRPRPPAMRITSKSPEEVRLFPSSKLLLTPLSRPGAHFSPSFMGYALNSSCKTQLQCHLLGEALSTLCVPEAQQTRRPPFPSLHTLSQHLPRFTPPRWHIGLLPRDP